MAPISTTVEIDRTPEVVFAYATDPTRFSEWQSGVVGGHMEGKGPIVVGQKCMTTRKIGFAERPITSEVTHFEAPRTWGVRGVDGPIRATVDVTVEPLDDRNRARLTIDVDFEGRGIGKIIVPLAVRRQARNEMPANLQTLKENLENGTTGV